MKITKVTPLIVKIPKEDSFGGHGRSHSATGYFTQPGWRGAYSDQTETTLVKVETDAGPIGFGEGQSPIAPEVTASIISHLFGPHLIGREVSDVAVLHREMYQMMNIRGHYGGYIKHAVSAIDIALWDLRGKQLGEPVAKLLGGVFRDQIPAYVSGVRGQTLEEKVAAIRRFRDSGFTALKTFLGFGVQQDLEQVEAFVEAVGPGGRLMVDVLWNYDVTTALQLGRSLEKLGIAWLEAPTAPEDIAGHAEIARALDMPVAAGETETTPHQFLPWFQQRGLDIAQPDVARCGITDSMRICALADAFHLPVALHSGILLAPGLAASLQVAAAVPNLIYQEYQPVMTELASSFLKRPLICRQGMFELPAGPGLGIEMNEEALQPYLVHSR